jgi:hypothetical protein
MFGQAWPQVRILLRGDVENRIKELEPDLKADPSASLRTGRTSCHRFLANKKASEGGRRQQRRAKTDARPGQKPTSRTPDKAQVVSRHNYKTYSQLVQGYLWQ